MSNCAVKRHFHWTGQFHHIARPFHVHVALGGEQSQNYTIGPALAASAMSSLITANRRRSTESRLLEDES